MIVAERSSASRRLAPVSEQLALRADRDAIERRERSLRGRVVPADRLDDVADELEADGLRFGGGIEVDDAAAHAELAVLVDRILRREAGAARAARPDPAARSRRPGASIRPASRMRAGIGQPRQRARGRTRRRCRGAAGAARGAPGRARTPPRDAARDRGTDRLPATGTAGRRSRRLTATAPRDSREKTGRRRHLLDVASVGTTSRTGASCASAAAWNAVPAGVRPVNRGVARPRPDLAAAVLSNERNAREDPAPITLKSSC